MKPATILYLGLALFAPIVAGAEEVAAQFPQEAAIAAAPLPYDVRAVSLPGGAEGVTLAGDLNLPKAEGPRTAVLLIAGSGPSTRDEEVEGHKIFLVLGDALARAGVVVLRLDKRGIGQSTGDYASATTQDFARDASAAIDFLAAQDGVDRDHIGVIGLSEGGAIAPMVANQNPEVDFAILLSAPGRRGDLILEDQFALISAAEGAGPEDIAVGAKENRTAMDIVIASADAKTAEDGLHAWLDPRVATGEISPEDVTGTIDFINGPWMRAFLTLDPAIALSDLQKPVLVVAGDKDLQVPPATNLPVIRAALADNPAAVFVELPDLNHLLQTANTGSPSEYGTIAETMAPVALSTITDFVAAQR